MTLSLIVGRPNSGRVGEVLRRLEQRRELAPLLVVPTADDVARFETDLCAGGRPVLGASILTFHGLFEELSRSLGVDAPPALSGPQRLALVRAAIRSMPLRALGRSAQRSGFAPALDALIAELQAGLVDPGDLEAGAAELEDGEPELELARLYRAYVELRERAGRADQGSIAQAVLAGLRAAPDAWGSPPVLLYGFDDLTEAQLELVAELARTAEVTVAVNYADRRALAARARLLARLAEDVGGEVVADLARDDGYTEQRSLRHLDEHLFEPGAPAIAPDEGLLLLECAGEQGEAEAIAIEIARLLDGGAAPDDIAAVVRNPHARGPLLGRVLEGFGIPAAVEAHVPLARTAVGAALCALCRAASDSGAAEDLLAHLRADPAIPPTAADWVERRIMRGEARTPAEAIASWSQPPRHLRAVEAATGPEARLRALARIARELAEAPMRGAAPVVGARRESDAEPEPLELRAGAVASELLAELADVGRLPGCEPPGLADAIEAIEGATVPLWRGSTRGRVRVLSPYRMRAGRARYLFCASLQDGEFPRPAAASPLLGDERRRALGIPALVRQEPADEERYLFHACVSRPTERLYLCWRSCADDGKPLARSPFVDEVLDLFGPDPAAAEAALKRSRGLERAVPRPHEAPTPRELARALAVGGQAPSAAHQLRRLEVGADVADEVVGLLRALPPSEDEPGGLPGPLRADPVLADLGERRVLSAGSLEGWLECPYRWFVDHELQPQRLEPEADPLWLGGIVHDALERLYREPPGEDTIPRPGDVGRWKRRFAELLEEAAQERGGSSTPERAIALARARSQVESFLDDEARLETSLRPRPDLVEVLFGFEGEGDPGPLGLGEISLRGRIDRIDVAPDGRGAVVRDYKTSREVPGADDWKGEGKLQLQLYMRVARDRLGLEPIGGLFQPLGAYRDRRPRGIVVRGDERLEGLDLVWGSKDVVDSEELDAELDRAYEQAVRKGAEMRRGEIGRRPLGGNCPEYCTYQTICRLERSLGPLEGENGGEET
jgi:ATP-dependent helicase/DNAse subunit B